MACDDWDTENFIALVKAHPEIWRVGSEVYKDKRKRDDAWNDVAKNLLAGFENMEDREKLDCVKRAAAKWRNLRDNYSKSEKKRSRSGQPAAKSRRYIYARQLSFLEESKSLTESQSSKVSSEGGKETPSVETPKHEEVIKESNHMRTTMPSSSKERMGAENRREDIETALLKYMNEPTPSVDEDQSFFDSLLPSVRRLNEDQKLEFRSQVLNVLIKIKRGVK